MNGLVFALVMLAAPGPAGADPSAMNRAGVKIFFGHQSVGGNILEGVREQRTLTVAPLSKELAPLGTVVLAEAMVGQNEQPLSKLGDFEKLTTDNAATLDAAMFKFCYIDFNGATDVPALFKSYKETMERIANAHPKITFAHVTTPLTVVQSGLLSWMKSLLGRPRFGYIENQKRAEWNALLRAHYAGKAPIFDLADLESRDASGEPVSYDVDGKRFPMLFAGFSDDGGHLNQDAKRRIGQKFTEFVLALAASRAAN